MKGERRVLDQRYFKYIKTIAQCHSFSKAAQILYISQPALSRFVKKVEDELGVSLFDRDTIPLGLTPAGERYLEYLDQFQSLEQVRARHKEMKYGINKFFYFLYRGYTLLQVKATPSLQGMLRSLHARYGDDIPEDIRIRFRKQSKELMHMVDLLTFNGRTIVMFVVVLVGEVWVYFLYEIIVLNIVLLLAMRKHEQMCATFYK